MARSRHRQASHPARVSPRTSHPASGRDSGTVAFGFFRANSLSETTRHPKTEVRAMRLRSGPGSTGEL